MLIGDYLSSNIIICILFWFDPFFRELGQTYNNIFFHFLVQMKTSKFAFEINWPLKRRKRCESLSRKNSWKLIRNLPLKNHAYTRYVPLKINTGCSFSEWIILSSFNPKYNIRFTGIIQMDNLKIKMICQGGDLNRSFQKYVCTKWWQSEKSLMLYFGLIDVKVNSSDIHQPVFI